VDGFSEDASVVVVLALTVCVKDDDVLVTEFPSPLYTARMVWLPGLRADVANVA